MQARMHRGTRLNNKTHNYAQASLYKELHAHRPIRYRLSQRFLRYQWRNRCRKEHYSWGYRLALRQQSRQQTDKARREKMRHRSYVQSAKKCVRHVLYRQQHRLRCRRNHSTARSWQQRKIACIHQRYARCTEPDARSGRPIGGYTFSTPEFAFTERRLPAQRYRYIGCQRQGYGNLQSHLQGV